MIQNNIFNSSAKATLESGEVLTILLYIIHLLIFS